jgi:23S rRNA (uridine2552-2'-O)-methyltransferase
MARSKSSERWLQRHFADPYVKRAQKEGARSRATFKLEEIAERDRLLKPGMVVVDLGAAPGGWSEYAVRKLGPKGRVIALDVLPMAPLDRVEFIEGDFTEEAVLNLLLQRLEGVKVDLVMSDMAPNISGVAASDIPRAMLLAELALEFAAQTLKPGGALLMKVFQGEGFPALLKALRAQFAEVGTRKPKASRPESRELYLLAKGFKGAATDRGAG